MQLYTIFKLINIILIIFFCFIILLDHTKPPEVTFSWLIIILVFQFFGIVIYILTGVNYKARKIVAHLPEEIFKTELSDIVEEQKKFYTTLKKEDEDSSDMVKAMSLLLNCSNSIVTTNNRIQIFHDGEKLFKELLLDLKDAKSSIHMEAFIWESDNLGNKIKDVLINKAKEGVEVRLIFDGVGSFNRISLKYKRELKKAGVKFYYFLDPLATPLKFLKFNYSNHRKIFIIDGHIGYTGGFNIGDEYIDGGPRFNYWQDTHIKLHGDSVRMLQAVFLTDWMNTSKEKIQSRKYFPVSPSTTGIPTQIAVSGPDSKWSSIHQLYFSMITNANRKILIQSPYFVPDRSILKALETAALSGVEVHLLMTGNPDKRLPFWTAKTYFDTLISAGVNIYLYNKGFLHSKVVIVDEIISTVGSCNMDIRSFHINYEVNAVAYDMETSKDLSTQFYKNIENSTKINKEDLEHRSLFVKTRDSICRLLAPIM